MQVKPKDIFFDPSVITSSIRSFIDANKKQYLADDLLNGYKIKKPFYVLDPFTNDPAQKKIIRQILEAYLNEVIPLLSNSPPISSKPESERLLPCFHEYQGNYYAFSGLGGFIRKRHKQPDYRIEFIKVNIGNGVFASVFITATVIFDQEDSFTLKEENKKPRALKKAKINPGSAAEQQKKAKEIRVLESFPYEQYKLKQTFFAREDDTLYLYIPHRFFNGPNLADYIKNNRVTGKESIQFAISVGEAVNYVHQYRVLHRDIKPENLIITDIDKKQMVPIDFGLSIFFRDDMAFHRHSGIVGTPLLMAPECFYSRVYNEKTDEYATILTMAACFYAIAIISDQTNEKYHGNFSNLYSLLLSRIKVPLKFRGLGDYALKEELPQHVLHSIKETFRAGTHHDANQRMSLATVMHKLREYESLCSVDNKDQSLKVEFQYTKAVATKTKNKLNSAYYGITEKIQYLTNKINKISDNEECVTIFLQELDVKSLLSCKSKQDIFCKLKIIEKAMVIFADFKDYMNVGVMSWSNNSSKVNDFDKMIKAFQDKEIKQCNSLCDITIYCSIDKWMAWHDKVAPLNFSHKQIIIDTIKCILQHCNENQDSFLACLFSGGGGELKKQLYPYLCKLTDKDKTRTDQEKVDIIDELKQTNLLTGKPSTNMPFKLAPSLGSSSIIH